MQAAQESTRRYWAATRSIFANVSKTAHDRLFRPVGCWQSYAITLTVVLFGFLVMPYLILKSHESIGANMLYTVKLNNLITTSEFQSFNQTVAELMLLGKERLEKETICQQDIDEEVAHVASTILTQCQDQAARDPSIHFETCVKVVEGLKNMVNQSSGAGSFQKSASLGKFVSRIRARYYAAYNGTTERKAIKIAIGLAGNYGSLITRAIEVQKIHKQTLWQLTDADFPINHLMGAIAETFEVIFPSARWSVLNFLAGLTIVFTLGVPGIAFFCFSYLSGVHYLHSLVKVSVDAFGGIQEQILGTPSMSGYILHALSYKSLSFTSLLIFIGFLYDTTRFTSGFLNLSEKIMDKLESLYEGQFSELWAITYIVRPAKFALKWSNKTVWCAIVLLIGVQSTHGALFALWCKTNPFQFVGSYFYTSFINPYVATCIVILCAKHIVEHLNSQKEVDARIAKVGQAIVTAYEWRKTMFIVFAILSSLTNSFAFFGIMKVFSHVPGIVTPEENLVVAVVTEIMGHLFVPTRFHFTK